MGSTIYSMVKRKETVNCNLTRIDSDVKLYGTTKNSSGPEKTQSLEKWNPRCGGRGSAEKRTGKFH
jgi:hypothetical protein